MVGSIVGNLAHNESIIQMENPGRVNTSFKLFVFFKVQLVPALLYFSCTLYPILTLGANIIVKSTKYNVTLVILFSHRAVYDNNF